MFRLSHWCCTSYNCSRLSPSHMTHVYGASKGGTATNSGRCLRKWLLGFIFVAMMAIAAASFAAMVSRLMRDGRLHANSDFKHLDNPVHSHSLGLRHDAAVRDGELPHDTLPDRVHCTATTSADKTVIDVFLALPTFTHADFASVKNDSQASSRNILAHPSLLGIASWLALGSGIAVHIVNPRQSVVIEQLLEEMQTAATEMRRLHRNDRLDTPGIGTLHVTHHVDANWQGTPLVHSLWRAAEQSTADFIAVVHSDVIIHSSYFWRVMTRLSCVEKDFVIAASALEVTAGELPTSSFELLASGGGWDDIALHGRVCDRCGADVWLWNRRRKTARLIERNIPPFVLGKGSYQHWITESLLGTHPEQLIDATDALSLLRFVHTSAFSPIRSADDSSGGSWDVMVNDELARAEGVVAERLLKRVPRWLTTECENGRDDACVITRLLGSAQHKPSPEQTVAKSFEDISARAPPGGLHTLQGLLDALLPPADARKHRQIILLTATMDYRDMLMNWVCNYRRLQADNAALRHPFMIAALDEEVFRWGFTNGLPIFFIGLHTLPGNVTVHGDCSYNTECFKAVTKLKSRVVLEVLRKGVDVMFTDPDIVWFDSPLARPEHFGGFVVRDIMYVQSNQPDVLLSRNEPRRINSGFYFVPSTAQTVRAFQAIIEHAASSTTSEQPSFYDVLCGPNGEYRASTDECLRNHLRVRFLPLETYPNGASYGHWDAGSSLQMSTAESCRQLGCVILHNNWIAGLEEKRARQEAEGLWFVTAEGTCMYA